MTALRHVPALDGVRAVAILGVVIFHAFPDLCPGGFAGVDVFFVLSGYLITGILRRSIEAGDMSLLAFYERRARRILPALVVMLAAVTALALLIMMPSDLERFGTSVVGASMSCANILFYRSINYFEPASSLLPLLHTWSLSVEEQFYVLFPLVLMFAYRLARKRVPEVVLAFFLGSLAVSVLGAERFPTGSFFLLPTRAWELCAGALLAWGRLPVLNAPALREATAAVGVAMMLTTYAVVDVGIPWPGTWALLPCAGAALTILAVTGGPTWTARLLACPPMVGIGLISYSLYLWHWPLLALQEYVAAGAPPSNVRVLGCLVIAFAMAWLSWRWIEQPFRTKHAYFAGWSRRRVLSVSVGVLGALACLGVALYRAGGWPGRLTSTVLAVEAFRKDREPDDPGHFSSTSADFSWERLPRLGEAVPPTIALLGDSHAEAIFSMLGEVAKKDGRSVVAYLLKGVPPLCGIEMSAYPNRQQIRLNVEAAFTRIAREKDISTVLLAARWAVYVHGLGLDGRVHFNNRPPHLRDGAGAGLQDDLALLRQGLNAGIATLLAAGKRIVIIGPIPELGFSAPLALAQAVRFGRDPKHVGVTRDSFLHRQEGILDILDHLPTAVTLLSPAETFWDGTLYRAGSAESVWYFDDNHLSLTGARHLAPLFTHLFSPISNAHAAPSTQPPGSGPRSSPAP